jgi:hypothetical protein
LFEATISDLPGRKMAELYKTKILPERIAGTEQVESDQDIRDLFFKMDAELARTMLVNACAKKLDKKRYDSSWGLVIHLNPSCGSDERASVEAVLAEATASVKDAFSEVWVLWGKRLYQTWLDGRPSSRPFATLVEEENWKSDGAAFSALFEPD